jgi:uncharacterized protein YfdQ (DUF2303 family)
MSDEGLSGAEVTGRYAISSVHPVELDPAQTYSVTLPEHATHQLLDLERFLPEPRRMRGTVVLHEADSLTAYVLRNVPEVLAGAGLWTDWKAGTVIAVLNGSDRDRLGWGDHRATLTVRPTPEWERWTAHDGKLLEQEEFARHVERSDQDFLEPSGAAMLELALTIEAHLTAEFSSAMRLNNGTRRFLYREDVEAKAGAGAIEIPAEFTVGLAPWEGSSPFKLTAKLIYRLKDGTLRIGYELLRVEECQRTAFAEMVNAIAAGTGLPVFAGVPPAPVPAAR